MKYSVLIKEIRLELSEAAAADKRGDKTIAKACLLHVKKLVNQKVKG